MSHTTTTPDNAGTGDHAQKGNAHPGEGPGRAQGTNNSDQDQFTKLSRYQARLARRPGGAA